MSNVLASSSRLKPEIRLAQAVSQCDADLSRDQKAALRMYRLQIQDDPPGPSDVMRLTAEIDRGNKGGCRCVGPRMTNFLSAVQQFATTGDTMIGGSQNLIACGVWSLVRMSLLSIVKFSSYLEKLSNLLMNAGRSAPRYQNLALFYSRSKKLQSHLSEYFIVVVGLCHSLFRFAQKSTIGQFASSLSDFELKTYQSNLDIWANLIKEEISMLVAEKIEEEEEVQENTRFRALSRLSKTISLEQKLKTKLRVLDYCSTYDYERPWRQTRKVGYVTSFSGTAEYLDWKGQADSCTLLYTGKLGSGKSVLLANIVDDLNLFVDSKDIPVAYFFCRFDIAESLDARTVINSLARQFLLPIPDLGMVVDLLNETTEAPNFERIFGLLQRALPPNYKAYVILDGLDEMSYAARTILIRQIRKLQETFALLLCVSLRFNFLGLREFTACRLVTIPSENPDIRRFVDEELEARISSRELVIGNPSLKLEIRDAIVGLSGGMFLWATLKINSICDMISDYQIRESLTDFPEDLAEPFSRSIKILMDQPLQRRTLEIISVAQRPLMIGELRDAISVVPNASVWDPTKFPNDLFSQWISSESLFTIDEEEQTIRLVHHSVRELLFRGTEDSNKIGFTKEDANRTMADIIITYLSYEIFETQLSTKVVPQIKASLAPSQIIRSTLGPSGMFQKLSLKLLRSKSLPNFDIGRGLAEAGKVFNPRFVDQFHFRSYARSYWLQHILCISELGPGVDDLLLQLFKSGALRTNETAADGQTPLSWATMNGHEAIVKLLLDSNEVNPNSKDRDGRTPLLLAAMKGHQTIVRLLLDCNKVDPNSRDLDQQTPLMLASMSGHEAIVKLLLSSGRVDACSKDKDGQTALSLATANGHSAVVKLMINSDDQFAETEADAETDLISEVSEASSVFSAATLPESELSMGTAPDVAQRASEQLAGILAMDPELQIIYPEAFAKFSRAKFSRNHDYLLKRFFKDLRTEAQQPIQVQTVRVLRGRYQREEVNKLICTLLDSSNSVELQAMQMFQQQRPDRQYTLNWLLKERFLATKVSDLEQSNNEVSVAAPGFLVEESGGDTTDDDDDDDDGDDDDDDDNSEEEFDNHEVNSLDAIVAFLTKGAPFDRFKAGLHRFVHAPTTLQEAMSYRDLDFLRKFLEKQFNVVAKDEYSWLRELDDVGYTREEIAELLLEATNDAPWIYFDPDKYQHHDIQEGFHLQECIHRYNLLSTYPNRSLAPSRLPALTDGKDTLKSVQELCGLAGVAPVSRNRREWNGDVRFENENSTAIVSYTLLTDEEYPDHSVMAFRIKKALEGFCGAAGQVQAIGFCCDSFTIIRIPPYDLNPKKGKHPEVELWRIELKLAVQLFAEFKHLCLLDRVTPSDVISAVTVAAQILEPLLPGTTRDLNEDSLDHMLHICSLAVQILCIGFLSYTQAHIGPLQPFFLDTPQRKILLLGIQTSQEHRETIKIECVDFTCLANMTQGPVLTFSMVQAKGDSTSFQHSPKYNLLASPEDLLDTWGPGQYLNRTGWEGDPFAIIIGGGIIYANDPTSSAFHWSDSVGLDDPYLVSFDTRTKITIGALVAVNDKCSIDEESCWLKSCSAFSILGTFGSCWKADEIQVGIQAGQYVLGQFNQTWRKTQGKTLKQSQLEQEDDLLLPFLETIWGLQVSFCTSVARRVPLRELVLDVLPIFAKTLYFQPDLWGDLEATNSIADAFQKHGLREWIKSLKPELQKYLLQLIRRILMILRHTGVDREEKNLIIAWPQVGDVQRCFSIPCEKQNFWTRILADSEDCATFAYISSKCLETKNIKCSGPSPAWQNASTILETAVILHQSIPSTIPWSLEHKQWYFIKKSNSLFLVKVHRPDKIGSACLIASPSTITQAIQRRLAMREERGRVCRLRERQALYEPAEVVVVSASSVIG